MKLTCYAEVWPPFNTIRPLNIEEHGDLVRNRRAVMVRLKGLEPTRLATREPKSRMSTNSITGAYAIDS